MPAYIIFAACIIFVQVSKCAHVHMYTYVHECVWACMLCMYLCACVSANEFLGGTRLLGCLGGLKLDEVMAFRHTLTCSSNVQREAKDWRGRRDEKVV